MSFALYRKVAQGVWLCWSVFSMVLGGVYCYESRILQRLDDVGMTHKHVSNETLEVIFAVTYLRVVII
jgi:hypothetical protein